MTADQQIIQNELACALTADDIRQIAGYPDANRTAVQWHSKRILVAPYLGIHAFLELIHRTLDDCCSEDQRFAPELLDFAFRINVISAYAIVTMPTDIDELFFLAYQTDLYDTVCAHISKSQLMAAKDTVRFMAESTVTRE